MFFFPDITINKVTVMILRCSGAKSVRQVARERAKQILKENEHVPLDKDIEQKVKEIIRDRNDT